MSRTERRRPDRRPGVLDRYLRRIDRLTPSDLVMIRGLWDGADEDRRVEAWREVKELVQALDRTAELEGLEERLARWARGGTATGSLSGAFLTLGTGTFPMHPTSDLLRAALPPLLDAGAALLLRGELSPDAFEVLIGPWSATQAPSGAQDDES